MLRTQTKLREVLDFQSREIINNVYTYFKSVPQESDIVLPDKHVVLLVSEATGVSECNVWRIIRENKKLINAESKCKSNGDKQLVMDVAALENENEETCVSVEDRHEAGHFTSQDPSSLELHAKESAFLQIKEECTDFVDVGQSPAELEMEGLPFPKVKEELPQGSGAKMKRILELLHSEGVGAEMFTENLDYAKSMSNRETGQNFGLNESNVLCWIASEDKLKNATTTRNLSEDQKPVEIAPVDSHELELKKEKSEFLTIKCESVPECLEEEANRMEDENSLVEEGKTSKMSKFTVKERELLAEICKNYPILADMGYNADVLSKKQKAWLEIQKEFNSLTPGKPPRDLAQLKGLWKRLKMKTKADLDARKRDAKKTGGGPPTPPLTKSELILADMFSGHFDALPDTMDDDAGSFQEGPGEGTETVEEEIPPSASYTETPTQLSKKKKNTQSELQQRLLEMAEEEHAAKMEILKEKMLIVKKKSEYREIKLSLLCKGIKE